MSQINNWLVDFSRLELFLKDRSIHEDKRDDFPSCDSSYFSKYIKAKEIFQNGYYEEIDQSANSTETNGTVYTKHGIPHVRSLIQQVEKMIFFGEDSRTIRINGYESFLLLMSILLHDLGMFYGRKKHEKMCFKIINKHYKNIGISREEADTIARISESHSESDIHGRPVDTLISLKTLETSCGVQYRERMIAAILRFADEISDNDTRAYDFVEKNNSVNDYEGQI
jgi:hypothetical protein